MPKTITDSTWASVGRTASTVASVNCVSRKASPATASATTGGVGTPLGAIFGAAIIGIIENIIVLFGVSPYWQGMVSGVIVVLAISFDSISRRYLRADAG